MITRKSGRRNLLTVLVLVTVLIGQFSAYGAERAVEGAGIETGSAYSPKVVFVEHNPTAFAKGFIEASEGQQWFLDEIERLLHYEQKTINRMEDTEYLERIASLGLADRGLTGHIPRSIGYLTNLKYLFLGGNELTGPIPEELFTLTKLVNVDLSQNLYEGNIPKAFSDLTNLEVLHLWGNGFAGAIPLELFTLSKLESLDLSQNNLSGGIPEEIADLTSLMYLGLSDNPLLGGELPESLYRMDKLEVINCWNCGLSGTLQDGASGIENLQRLKILDLTENQLEGELPFSIGTLKLLRELSLADNGIRGAIPDMFSDLELLEEVHLWGNYLRGHTPDTLKGRYEEGARVTLQENYVTGENSVAIETDRKEKDTTVTENFTDGAEGSQYQLTGPTYVQISETRTVNVYPYLSNKPSGKVNLPVKVMLWPEEYEAGAVAAEHEDKLEVLVDSAGIHIKATEEILYQDRFDVAVWIKDNKGSNLSTTTIKMSTEGPPVNTGGPGPGGGTSVPDPEPEVEYEQHDDYISGYEDGAFRPEDTISREELAVMASRLMGSGLLTRARSRFSDVEDDRWSSGYIEHARKKGTLSGYPDASGGMGVTFRPEAGMTRAEFSSAVVRMMGLNPVSLPQGFDLTDVKEDWAAGYIYAAWQAGYVTGYEDHTFKGDQEVTRAEAVTMLNRALKRVPFPGLFDELEVPFSDVDESHWAWLEILEAALEHPHPLTEEEILLEEPETSETK